MGHREDLLEGAKRCLLEKGFVRTTARDIVKESGTNLASIGYHYGSKDALLTQAFVELVQEWGEKFDRPWRARPSPGGSLERFRERVGADARSHARSPARWAASMEIATQGRPAAGAAGPDGAGPDRGALRAGRDVHRRRTRRRSTRTDRRDRSAASTRRCSTA